MLIPGVGTLTAMPPPAVTRVFAESLFAAPALAAPICRFRATGIKLPPIILNAALPPTDVALSAAPLGSCRRRRDRGQRQNRHDALHAYPPSRGNRSPALPAPVKLRLR